MGALELFGALALMVLFYLVVESMNYELDDIPGPFIARFRTSGALLVHGEAII